MPEALSEQERNQFWEVYQKADSCGKKSMVKMAHSFLNIQLLGEGKKLLQEKESKNKKP
jgi:hypothetical protein